MKTKQRLIVTFLLLFGFVFGVSVNSFSISRRALRRIARRRISRAARLKVAKRRYRVGYRSRYNKATRILRRARRAYRLRLYRTAQIVQSEFLNESVFEEEDQFE